MFSSSEWDFVYVWLILKEVSYEQVALLTFNKIWNSVIFFNFEADPFLGTQPIRSRQFNIHEL